MPVLLSIGYSTCHWCHMMAHESFENEEVAAIMNRDFVNIKVDREERPDVDRVYMTFVQATTGGGGWPMSVFMTPDREPFFCGTYFPRAPVPAPGAGRGQGLAGGPGPGGGPGPADSGGPGRGRPPQAAAESRPRRQARARRRPTVRARRTARARRTVRPGQAGHGAAGELAGLAAGPAAGPGESLAAGCESAVAVLAGEFDAARGGFGGAPKFPPSMVLEFLLRHA